MSHYDEPQDNNPNVRVMSAHYNARSQTTLLRILVDARDIKYISLPWDVYDAMYEDNLSPKWRLLRELLPPLPPGRWEKAVVERAPSSRGGVPEQLRFKQLHPYPMPADPPRQWHSACVNELDLPMRGALPGSTGFLSSHPGLDRGRTVRVRTAVWPREVAGVRREEDMLRCVHGSRVGPELLAHVRAGRGGHIIGFVASWPIADPRSRPVDTGDMAGCHMALSALHSRGVCLGAFSRNSFVVLPNGAVSIQHLGHAREASDARCYREMSMLAKVLEGDELSSGPPSDDGGW